MASSGRRCRPYASHAFIATAIPHGVMTNAGQKNPALVVAQITTRTVLTSR